MLKGSSEFPLAVGVVIFVLVFIALFSYILYEGASVKVTAKTSEEKLNEIDIANIARSCLEEKQVMQETTLDQKKGQDLLTLCNINNKKATVLIKDLATNKPWTFGPGASEEGHKILVNIASGKEIHIGELYANV